MSIINGARIFVAGIAFAATVLSPIAAFADDVQRNEQSQAKEDLNKAVDEAKRLIEEIDFNGALVRELTSAGFIDELKNGLEQVKNCNAGVLCKIRRAFISVMETRLYKTLKGIAGDNSTLGGDSKIARDIARALLDVIFSKDQCAELDFFAYIEAEWQKKQNRDSPISKLTQDELRDYFDKFFARIAKGDEFWNELGEMRAIMRLLAKIKFLHTQAFSGVGVKNDGTVNGGAASSGGTTPPKAPVYYNDTSVIFSAIAGNLKIVSASATAGTAAYNALGAAAESLVAAASLRSESVRYIVAARDALRPMLANQTAIDALRKLVKQYPNLGFATVAYAKAMLEWWLDHVPTDGAGSSDSPRKGPEFIPQPKAPEKI